MARRWVKFLCETQARLGWVDTPWERWVFKISHVVCQTLSRPKSMTAVCLALLLAGGPCLKAQDGGAAALAVKTFHTDWLRTNGLQEKKRILEKGEDFLKDNQKWIQGIVMAYRTIKLAKAAYQQLATFDLKDHLQLVDIIPEIKIDAGTSFGSDGSGSNTGQKSNTYSVRLQSRNGGISKLFKKWPKFEPNLKVDMNDLSEQLANLDFDASAVIQHHDTSNNPIGSAIASGSASAAQSQVGSFWHNLLLEYNNWPKFRSLVRIAKENLSKEQEIQNSVFDNKVYDLQAMSDKDEKEFSTIFTGGKLASKIDYYNAHLAPRIQLAREKQNIINNINKNALRLTCLELENVRRNDENIQSAITYLRESSGVMASNQGVIKVGQTVLKSLQDLMDQVKSDRDFIDTKIMGKVEIPTQGDKGTQRPDDRKSKEQQTSAKIQQTLLSNSMQLSHLDSKKREMDILQKTLNKIEDTQKILVGLAKTTSDTSILDAAKKVRSANTTYVNTISQTNPKMSERSKILQSFPDAFKRANETYMKAVSEKMSPQSLLEKITKQYSNILKGMILGHSMQDIIAMNKNKNNDKAEFSMYEACIKGAKS